MADKTDYFIHAIQLIEIQGYTNISERDEAHCAPPREVVPIFVPTACPYRS